MKITGTENTEFTEFTVELIPPKENADETAIESCYCMTCEFNNTNLEMVSFELDLANDTVWNNLTIWNDLIKDNRVLEFILNLKNVATYREGLFNKRGKQKITWVFREDKQSEVANNAKS